MQSRPRSFVPSNRGSYSHGATCGTRYNFYAKFTRDSFEARYFQQDHASRRSECSPTLSVSIPRGHERNSPTQYTIEHRIPRLYKLPIGAGRGNRQCPCANAKEVLNRLLPCGDIGFAVLQRISVRLSTILRTNISKENKGAEIPILPI